MSMGNLTGGYIVCFLTKIKAKTFIRCCCISMTKRIDKRLIQRAIGGDVTVRGETFTYSGMIFNLTTRQNVILKIFVD